MRMSPYSLDKVNGFAGNNFFFGCKYVTNNTKAKNKLEKKCEDSGGR